MIYEHQLFFVVRRTSALPRRGAHALSLFLAQAVVVFPQVVLSRTAFDFQDDGREQAQVGSDVAGYVRDTDSSLGCNCFRPTEGNPH